MASNATGVFMAAARIAQHFGRPAPNEQAWVESFFGHLKGKYFQPGQDHQFRLSRRSGALRVEKVGEQIVARHLHALVPS